MGNNLSQNGDNEKLLEQVEHIAAEYILSQPYKDLSRLHNPSYCNELVILTTDIINKHLNIEEVQHINNKMSEDVLWINKNNLPDDKIKHVYCGLMAKRYVKIAHIFSAIMTTINPIYIYTDDNGSEVSVSLMDKHLIPPHVHVDVVKYNLCNLRIDMLSSGLDTSSSDIRVAPNFCNINKEISLYDEPGIKELELLYNDIYNYDTGEYSSRSAHMEEQYEKDLEAYYKAFTGNKFKPVHIRSFKDIKISDVTDKVCDSTEASYEGSSTLFHKYADNIKESINSTRENENKLIKQLDKLFIKMPNGKYTINDNITLKKLDEIIDDTRNIIIKCYMTCEKYFLKGLEIFEAIVENQTRKVTESQIRELEKSIFEM